MHLFASVIYIYVLYPEYGKYMPRKELGAPSENRRRAEKFFSDGFNGAEKQKKSRNPDYGCDRTEDVDGEDFAPTVKKANKRRAREYAMALVSLKSYTEHALREKLKIRGYGCDETDEAIAYVKGFGYINDLRLAQNAAEKLADKPYGKRRILAYLRQKGISGEVISEIDLSEIDFKENARAYAEKLAVRGKTREQIARSLISAGFSSAEISFAISMDLDITDDEP